ncbi:unnamed protein product [Microthlaspi erraticum]|uniref:Uncharacterized protein n=1 Tax=Microthlaspi erraticum TaxID=1685480 RepID=A0A6D2JXI0_9BRAS|nr:unnamed protein product [Microthlaspi erraticum]
MIGHQHDQVDRGREISRSVVGFGRTDDKGLNVLAGREKRPSWSDGTLVRAARVVLRGRRAMPSCSCNAVVCGLWWRNLDGTAVGCCLPGWYMSSVVH